MLTGQSSAFDPMLVRLLDDGRFETAAERLFIGYEKSGIEEALRRMLALDFYARVSPQMAVARVTRELARHGAAPNRALSFLFWNRTRRELALAPYAMMSGVTVFSPYLDHALFDLLMGLPPPMLLDHAFHTDAIARAYPAARPIPFEHGDSVLTSDMFFRRAALDLASTVISSRAALRRRYVLPRVAMAVLYRAPEVPVVPAAECLYEPARRSHARCRRWGAILMARRATFSFHPRLSTAAAARCSRASSNSPCAIACFARASASAPR